MKALLVLLPIAALGLSSCASFSNAQQQADYNNDGFVSAAESQQFHRQKNVEDRAVYSESVKRRNVTNTARDARDGLGAVKDIQRIFKSF